MPFEIKFDMTNHEDEEQSAENKNLAAIQVNEPTFTSGVYLSNYKSNFGINIVGKNVNYKHRTLF